jgi:hypothetical protein
MPFMVDANKSNKNKKGTKPKKAYLMRQNSDIRVKTYIQSTYTIKERRNNNARQKTPQGNNISPENVVLNELNCCVDGRSRRLRIARPSKGNTEARAILNYNAFVMGEHNYYQMATGVSLDFRKIGYNVNKTVKRVGDRLKRVPKGKGEIGGAIVEKYGTSDMLRWVKNLPIAPISYVQTKAPMCKKRSIQKYTAEGRAEIHENLGIGTRMLKAMLRQQLYGRSAEYADNRLSLYHRRQK